MTLSEHTELLTKEIFRKADFFETEVSNLRPKIMAFVEPPLFKAVLEETGSQVKAAKALGMNRTTFRNKLKKYGML